MFFPRAETRGARAKVRRMPRRTFTTGNPKADKAALGATKVDTTPVAIRSRVELSESLRKEIRPKLSQHLGRHALQIQRVSVRFEDLNGPKGGVDMVCEIKIAMRGLPSVLITETAATPALAFRRAVPRATRAVRRELDKHGRSSAGSAPPRPKGAATRRRAAATRRAAAAPTVSRKASAPRATVVQEESAGAASRKSSRRSANRAKPSQRKERAAVAKTVRPGAKASRAKASRAKSRGKSVGRKR
jgi:ribosome-associated translation inhibitor RaiA